MNMKIEIKVGTIELNFEGAKEIYEEKFEPTFTSISDLIKGAPATASTPSDPIASAPRGPERTLAMTVRQIASKLDVSKGADLALAAVISLALIKRKDVFTRQEINDEMKQATGYYKTTYSSGNLSGYLTGLCKKETIVETSKDTYAVKESDLPLKISSTAS